MKLKSYLIGLVMAAMLLPILVGTLIMRHQHQIDYTDQNDQKLARMIAQLLVRELGEITRVFEMGSRMFDMQKLKPREITGVLRMLYKQHKDFNIVVLLNEMDQAVVDPVYLQSEQINTDQDSNHRLPVNQTDLGRFLRFLPLKEAREKGLALSDVYANKQTNAVMIAGALAIQTDDPTKAWVLGFESALRQLRHTATASLPESNYTVFIVDGGGRLVAHPDGAHFLHRASMQNHPLVAKFLAGARSGAMQWEDTGSKTENARLSGAFQWIDIADWAVVLQRPLNPLPGVIDGIPRWAWLGWLATALLILVNLFILERSLTKVLKEASQTKGDIERRANELGHLKASMLETSKLSAIGELGAGVAHELNNPLGGIMGLTQLLLRKKPDSDPEREFLNRIEQEAKRCKSITDNLLRFSEQQRIEYREPLRLERVTAMTIDLLSRKLESQRIKVVRRFAPNLPRIIGNEGQIQRAILDVCFNAETAMPDGGTLTFETKSDGDWVLLQVGDTGWGIPKENLDRVFEPFFTTKDNWKGAGLGLSVVYQVMKDHGGEVVLDSQEERGTVVTFRFPSEQLLRTREKGRTDQDT